MNLSSCILENSNSVVSELPTEISLTPSTMSASNLTANGSCGLKSGAVKKYPRVICSANRFIGSRIRAVYNDSGSSELQKNSPNLSSSSIGSSSRSSSLHISNTGFSSDQAQTITNMDSTSESTLASANAPVDRDTIYFRNRDYGSECHTRIGSKGGRFLSRCQVFIKRMQVAGSASKHSDKIDAARDNNIQWPVSVEQRLTEQRLLANNALHMRPLLQPSVATAILMRNSDCKSMSFNLWTPVSADGWVKQQTSKDLDL